MYMLSWVLELFELLQVMVGWCCIPSAHTVSTYGQHYQTSDLELMTAEQVLFPALLLLYLTLAWCV
jgi:hypothetical protein